MSYLLPRLLMSFTKTILFLSSVFLISYSAMAGNITDHDNQINTYQVISKKVNYPLDMLDYVGILSELKDSETDSDDRFENFSSEIIQAFFFHILNSNTSLKNKSFLSYIERSEDHNPNAPPARFHL